MPAFIARKLIVDDRNELFNAQGMKDVQYSSDLLKVRQYAAEILVGCREQFLEENLLEQQLSELIKNAIKHGNRSDPEKKIRVWYDLRNRARFIVEDEGEGFTNLESWNDFFMLRQKALYEQDFDTFLTLASYRGPHSDDTDGGNSLITALEYWNGGMIYNGKKNKVGVIRWFSSPEHAS
jgi:serine/threonine-protein kinase RsbW